MKLGIDASNIRTGGGLTHLRSLLEATNLSESKFDSVIVWASNQTLRSLPQRSWLLKEPINALEKNWIYRNLWQRFSLKKEIIKNQCDLLFVPGGSFFSSFRSVVIMNQNLLPFSFSELKRYGLSLMSLRLLLLRQVQSKSIKKSNGVIFLSKHARNIVEKEVGSLGCKNIIIPHGNTYQYKTIKKNQQPIEEYSFQRPFRVLYVSIIDVYKHHDEVMKAIKSLRDQGYPVALDLIGPSYKASKARFNKLRSELDPKAKFISYFGEVEHKKLNQYYRSADLGIWASSCETFGLILTEMMSCGLPIAASKGGPNDEILGEAGLYFNPEDPSDIANTIKQYLESKKLRSEKSDQAFLKSQNFNWQTCAKETFSFLDKVLKDSKTPVVSYKIQV